MATINLIPHINRKSDLNIFLIKRLGTALGLGHKTYVKASDFELRDGSTNRLVDICKKLNAGTYLSGQDGVKYMNMDSFERSGIRVVIQDFQHPVYPQVFGDFQSHMSVVDLLFNCGAKSLEKIEEVNPK